MIRLILSPVIVFLTVLSLQGQVQAQTTSPKTSKEIMEYQARINTLVETSRIREIEKREEEAKKQVALDKMKAFYANSSSTELPFNKEQKIINSNWQKFWDFYYQPDSGSNDVRLSGQKQSFSNDSIELNWTLPDEAQLTTGSQVSQRKLSYRWLKGSMSSQNAVELSLPDEPEDIFLRSSGDCLKFSFGPPGKTEVAISQWFQPKDWKIASGVTGPKPSLGRSIQASTDGSYQVIITPVDGQIINDWKLFIEDDSVFARNQNSGETLLIGNKFRDHRPVGFMTVSIDSFDPLTQSFLLNIDSARYPQSIFATGFKYAGENIASLINSEMSISDAMETIGKHFGFSVAWDDAETSEIARNQRFKKGIGNDRGAILYGIDGGLGNDFISEVLTSTSLRVSLSYKYKQEEEKNEFRKRLASQFAFETKLYSTTRLTAVTAAKLIEDMLHCYVIDAVTNDGMTSDPILLQGQYNSITAHPLDWRGSKQGPQVNCESVIADGETNTIVVKATAETQAKIAAWLQEIDESAKTSALGANEQVPERRRLQIVLLQGGKTGTAAFGTSVTYSASLPSQYGMTPDDLKIMGFDGAVELGRGLVELVTNAGDIGKSTIQLAKQYPIKVSYLDERSPYLIIQTQILDADNKDLAENTMMLEKGKPGYLGVTNLSGAIIAVVTWLDDDNAPN